MRALPAGPTVPDMLANAAFLIGLTLWLACEDERWTYAVPFERADHGFYRAAQHGLAAELSWPAGRGRRGTDGFPPPNWCPNCFPAARQGLLDAGVATAETDRLLGVIGARVATGQTGAAWQRAALASAEHGRGRDEALAVMLDRYLSCAATGQPVHTWPALPGDAPLQPGAGRRRVRVGGLSLSSPPSFWPGRPGCAARCGGPPPGCRSRCRSPARSASRRNPCPRSRPPGLRSRAWPRWTAPRAARRAPGRPAPG